MIYFRKYISSARYIFVTALLLVASLGVTSCTVEDWAPTLKVGAIPWIGYEPLFLARHLGHYNPENIKLVELQNATDTLQLLREGLIDVGALTLDETLGEVALGTDLVVILALDTSNGADVILAKPGFKDLQALKGRRIGLENNAVGAFVLSGALRASEMTVEDLTIVPLTADLHVSSYIQDDIDAVVTYTPMSKKILDMGATNIFDSRQIPNQIIDLLVVRKEVMVEQERNIKQLVEGYFKALKYLKESSSVAAKVMAPRLGLSGPEVLLSYEGVHLPGIEGNKELFSGSPKNIERIALTVEEALLHAKLLDRKVSSPELFSDQFIQR